jgi:AraC family transcriptional regulator, regulatory protein of adaptative response / methylated-DNA-[protein]-cysteine methyltransferase
MQLNHSISSPGAGRQTSVQAAAPGNTRDGIRYAIAESALGKILFARTAKGCCAILLGSTAAALLQELADRFPGAALVEAPATLAVEIKKVVAFVESPGTAFDLPLDLRGSAFQQQVWQALREIPAGSTASYSDIASRIGRPRAVRAVAVACAANILAVAIPCHRVVRRDGTSSGFRWGLERKHELLRRESAP